MDHSICDEKTIPSMAAESRITSPERSHTFRSQSKESGPASINYLGGVTSDGRVSASSSRREESIAEVFVVSLSGPIYMMS